MIKDRIYVYVYESMPWTIIQNNLSVATLPVSTGHLTLDNTHNGLC